MSNAAGKAYEVGEKWHILERASLSSDVLSAVFITFVYYVRCNYYTKTFSEDKIDFSQNK